MGGIVGVDVGGTGVRAARVDPAGRVEEILRRELPDRGPEAVIATVAEAVAALGEVEAVGVGVPGFVVGGTVVASPNFPAWRDEPLRAALEARLGVPVTVENDANAAALGAWVLEGGGLDLVLLTLGTGVGGGVVTGGRLLRGAAGAGAELGHLFAGGDAACGCGGIGCLETWCGTWGLQRLARARGHEVSDGADLVARASAGEPWALAVLEEAGDALGRGWVSLVNLFAPDLLLLTGGLTAAEPWLGPRAERWLRRYGIPPSVARVRVAWEGRAEDFAVVGAAASARGLDG